MHRDACDPLLEELRWLRGLAAALAGGDRELTDELVQDGALALLRQRTPVRSLRGWLATVLRRRAAALRGRRLQPLDTEPVDDDGDGAAEVAARLEAQQRLNAAVLDLPDPYRAVVVGHHLDGVSLADLARRRGVPAATVRQQHKRALELLRQRLDRQQGPGGSGSESGGWRAAVAPLLAVPGTLEVGAVASASFGGGIVMTKKLLAAAVVVLGAFWIWSVVGTSGANVPAAAGDEVGVATSDGGPRDDLADGSHERAPDRTTAAAPIAASDQHLQLSLRAGDGAPLVGAVVHCGRDGRSSLSGITDRDGRLSVAGHDGVGEVWVWARNRAPYRERLPALRGAHTVVLPDTPVVNGLLTIDGAPPGEAVVLSARWREDVAAPPLPHGWSGKGDRSIRIEQVLRFGGRWGGWIHPDANVRATVVVEPTGRFTLRGVPQEHLASLIVVGDGWSSIVPLRLRGRDGEPAGGHYAVPPAPETIHIELMRTPSLRARLVFADGEPVADARLAVRALMHDGSRSNVSGGHSDARGGVARSLLPVALDGSKVAWWRPDFELAVHELELHVEHADAVPTPLRWQATELAERTRDGTVDLGDVVVPRVHRLTVQVVDSEDRPVAGIRALLQRGLSEPTDAAGRTVVELAQATVRQLWVAGRGWGAQEAVAIGGDGTPQDPLRLRLAHPANRLTVRVAEAFASSGIDELQFGVECEQPLLPIVKLPDGAAEHGPTELFEVAGSSRWTEWRAAGADAPARLSTSLSDGRELVLVGVEPGR
ncbi:MAG: sigma-70 family RNA polymerase sigma factor, partial [Planctomycetes bacterium]|nr:sigma-70 family RNA polymerase sigma factor [Planctomycetota bacterium]